MRDIEQLEKGRGHIGMAQIEMALKLVELSNAITRYGQKETEARSMEVTRLLKESAELAEATLRAIQTMDEFSLPEVAEAIREGK